MKTIEVDPFDVRSVDDAIKALQDYEKERKEKIAKYIQRLCEEGATAARTQYGISEDSKSLTVSVKQTDDGGIITAKGEAVMFLEFGSGVYTTSHDLAVGMPFRIEAGSWSLSPEGSKTWLKVLNGEVAPEDYQYNTNPRAGMYEAYKAIVAAQDRIANEVFNK